MNLDWPVASSRYNSDDAIGYQAVGLFGQRSVYPAGEEIGCRLALAGAPLRPASNEAKAVARPAAKSRAVAP
jgi:hypothetical protein